MAAGKEIWPNFFIVGAAKAATTSLYYYLKKVPGVYMSPVKEPNYFAPHAAPHGAIDVITDKREYLDLFKNADGYNAIGEASPSYLWDPDAPRLIRQIVPNASIIIILRDPIERAYSQYLMRRKYNAKIASSFYDELLRDYESREKKFGPSQLYVEFGMYYEQVKRYFVQFGRERVKVIIFEEFIKHPIETVNEVLAFIGVDHNVNAIPEQFNPYSRPRGRVSLWIYAFFRWLRARNIKTYKLVNLLPDSLTESLAERFLFARTQKPAVQPEAKQFLEKLYYDDAIRLQSLLGRRLPWSILKQ